MSVMTHGMSLTMIINGTYFSDFSLDISWADVSNKCQYSGRECELYITWNNITFLNNKVTIIVSKLEKTKAVN